VSFLSPLFLTGLLALAVPILVHLRRRERDTTVLFPSLMFVKRIPHRSTRQQTIRRRWLFAARCAALSFLAIAFARPFRPAIGADDSSGSNGRFRVVLLDISASMAGGDTMSRARAQAVSALDELAGGDAAGVVLYSDRAFGVAPPSSDIARARAAVAAATPEERGSRLVPALQVASTWLGARGARRADIVVVTDGQRGSTSGASEVDLPQGVAIDVRSVGARIANAAITDVTVDRAISKDRERAAISCRIALQSDAPMEARVALEISGRRVEEKRVRLAASGVSTASFSEVPLPEGSAKGRVVLHTDAVPFDNTFHFVLGTPGRLGVSLIDQAPYLERALSIGDRPRFDVERRPNLSPSALNGRSLMIVNGSSGLSAAGPAIESFLARGHGALIALDGGALPNALPPLLGARFGASIDRLSDNGGSIGFVDLDHPALRSFKQASGGDFSRSRFLKYRAADSLDPKTRVLARFDDGRAAIFEPDRGDAGGRVIVFAGPLDGVASDLPLQPLFLPLIQELARYAAGYEEKPLAYRTGESTPLALATPAAHSPGAPTRRYRNTDGRIVAVPVGATAIELETSGFYEILSPENPPRLIAANVPTAESDLTFLDAEEFRAAMEPRSDPSAGPPGNESLAASPWAPESVEPSQGLWRIALGLVFAALVLEPWLTRRPSVARE
jgi:Mg-chelatase subunit ChlD